MFFKVIVVIALVFDQGAPCQIQDPGRGTVDEPAVVRYAQHGAFVSADRVLEDLLGDNVQMVCRLV